MRISFAWWNVGLKPPVATAKEPEESSVLRPWFLLSHLRSLIDLDLMAFGEVSEKFVTLIGEPLINEGYTPINITGKEGRLIFDIGVFYNNKKLQLINQTNITHPHYSGSLKVATRLDFLIPDTNENIYFYISHWPSRLSRPDIGRDELGIKLRMDIDSLFEIDGYQAKIVLLGDYNDEPFDKPIHDKLVATRDRKIVSDKPFILYNPFWRNLGGSAPYTYGVSTSPCHGTYHYKSSKYVTKWFTFDQIIVSSAFMGHSSWHLDEAETRVMTYNDESLFGADFFSTFDHLPIYGSVFKS